jgi:hypothetical protein
VHASCHFQSASLGLNLGICFCRSLRQMLLVSHAVYDLCLLRKLKSLLICGQFSISVSIFFCYGCSIFCKCTRNRDVPWLSKWTCFIANKVCGNNIFPELRCSNIWTYLYILVSFYKLEVPCTVPGLAITWYFYQALQLTLCIPPSFTTVLKLSSHLRLVLPNDLFRSVSLSSLSIFH